MKGSGVWERGNRSEVEDDVRRREGWDCMGVGEGVVTMGAGVICLAALSSAFRLRHCSL